MLVPAYPLSLTLVSRPFSFSSALLNQSVEDTGVAFVREPMKEKSPLKKITETVINDKQVWMNNAVG